VAIRLDGVVRGLAEEIRVAFNEDRRGGAGYGTDPLINNAPTYCPYPPILMALKPILRVVAASPPTCPFSQLRLDPFRCHKEGVAAEREGALRSRASKRVILRHLDYY
jgi:hypothetical protein